MDNDYVVVDTNVLLNYPDIVKNKKVLLHSSVLEELDNFKTDKKLSYKARQAIKMINDNIDKIRFDNNGYAALMPWGYNVTKVDNNLVYCAKDNHCKLITNDINMQVKARLAGVEVESYGNDNNEEYKGYRELDLDTDLINNLFIDIENGLNPFEFLENEYVIIHNTDLDDTFEYRYADNKLNELKLPSSKVIKGLNSQQRCALDLLNNKDIPIKVITGKFGSGKTLLSVKMGMHHVFDKGDYAKLFFIRNPIGSGEPIGFLPGGKNDKIKDFFHPIAQYLDRGIDELDYRMSTGQIVIDIPYYLKGLSIQDSFVIVDEAEDLDTNTIKLIGSRIDKDSCIVFCGDYKQSESKFKGDNGLKFLIDKAKDNPLCGIVYLDIDVRSEASKVFADL